MTNPPQRIFKIGTTLITEDATLAGKSLEEVRTLLKPAYPEIAHATIRETTLEDGSLLIHWIPQAGRKG